MGTLLLVIVVSASILYLVGRFSDNSTENKHKETPRSRQREIIVEATNTDEDPYHNYFSTYIAGVNHHASYRDIGAFVGVVFPETENSYDKNAMAISNMNGKLLGYIPKSQQRDYFYFSQNRPYPCVGYIFPTDPGSDFDLCGRVKVIEPCNSDYVHRETASYLLWFKSKYGAKYISKELQSKYLN